MSNLFTSETSLQRAINTGWRYKRTIVELTGVLSNSNEESAQVELVQRPMSYTAQQTITHDFSGFLT